MEKSYGKKFRILRKTAKITSSKAAEEVGISRSTLERWERGEAGLDIEKVFKLLEVIHVQKIDFFNNNISNYLKNITLEVSKAYESNDINYLKTQSKKLLSEVENDSFDKRTFLKAAIYCNAYYDLTGVDIFTDNYKKRLSMYFSKILSGDEVWYYDDVYFFGNTQNLISPRTIYSLSFSLVFYLKNNNDLEMKFSTAILNTLINAEYILIKKDLKKAKRLDAIISGLDITDRFAFEKIRYKYMHFMLNFLETNDDHNLRLMWAALELQGLNTLKDGFETAFKQIKQIYSKKS
ncbi:Rgg/GadR/MutR family transcriptional regulator [uncultured Lactobacillus sp.]|uniref:Rgg/GadR/MutR family transcriptional regulator n=1 Tax=uncultured Lactobacillus sp. TaxID=153152 RepID=UPI00258D33D1|nr:Rgg/GadR/MutR family transcriptional regulator [uncultured Lactobacillus sp.]